MAPLIWLASYPRSGNTFLRTILFQCFGLRSASIYPNDIQSPALVEAVGHLEHQDGAVDFGDQPVRLLKTHAPPQDDRPAIYVVRNGLDAVRSLYDFFEGKKAVEALISGYRFGSWAGHLRRWAPRERSNTLLLRYEDMQGNVPGVVEQLSSYLEREPIALDIPDRAALADGRWVKAAGKPKIDLTPEQMDMFRLKNGPTMEAFGYRLEWPIP